MSVLNEADIDITSRSDVRLGDTAIPVLVQMYREAYFVSWNKNRIPEYIWEVRYPGSHILNIIGDPVEAFLNNTKMVCEWLKGHLKQRVYLHRVDEDVTTMVGGMFIDTYIKIHQDEFASNYIIYNKRTDNCVCQISIMTGL